MKNRNAYPLPQQVGEQFCSNSKVLQIIQQIARILLFEIILYLFIYSTLWITNIQYENNARHSDKKLFFIFGPSSRIVQSN